MALQSTLFFDLVNGQETLTYTLNNSTVDQLVFNNSTNLVTLYGITGFKLAKSDFLLYNSFLVTFQNAIISNFPQVQNSRGLSLPYSSFGLQLENLGVENIYYTQTSLGNTVFDTSYVPSNQTALLSSRSLISITMQEFFVMCEIHNLFANQVGLSK